MSSEFPDSIKVTEQIGKGGFGVVYSGSFTDPRNGQVHSDVAIKHIHCKDEMSRRRHIIELKISQKIKSEHVVKLISAVENQNDLFIVMERMKGDGLMLMKKIKELKNASESTEIENLMEKITLQLLHGLEDIHKNCVLHRDIKPQNILIDENNNAKFSDFGMACFYKLCKGIAGTANYMEPACYLSWKKISSTEDDLPVFCEKLDEWSDIFSLGMTLFTILTGTQLLERPPRTVYEYKERLKSLNNILFSLIISGTPKMKRIANLIIRMIMFNPLHRPSPRQAIEFLETGDGSVFDTNRNYISCD